MIETLPSEWQKKWPELIPGTRFCNAAELKGAYVYLGSEASSYMTGKSWDGMYLCTHCINKFPRCQLGD